MNSIPVFPVTFMEDGSAECRARIMTSTNNSTEAIPGEGYPAKQANLTSITYKVTDLTDTSQTAVTGTVTISSAVYDTLQDHPLWQFTKGYNFFFTLPPTCFPIGGHTYTAEFKITYSGGDVGWLIFEGLARGVQTS